MLIHCKDELRTNRRQLVEISNQNYSTPAECIVMIQWVKLRSKYMSKTTIDQ